MLEDKVLNSKSYKEYLKYHTPEYRSKELKGVFLSFIFFFIMCFFALVLKESKSQSFDLFLMGLIFVCMGLMMKFGSINISRSFYDRLIEFDFKTIIDKDDLYIELDEDVINFLRKCKIEDILYIKPEKQT